MEDNYSKKLLSALILVFLLVLSFLVLKSILMSIIFAFILAFIFSPVYSFLFKITKSPNFSAFLITALLILIIVLPLWFFTPTIIKQSFNIYDSLQKTDFIIPLQKIFPSIFASDQFSRDVGVTIHSFITNSVNSLTTSLGDLILNFPSLILQISVLLFVFYFVLRDGDKLVEYLKSILPFSREDKNRFFKSSREITKSILYGDLIIGTIQGLIMGLGFFLFDIPNALILTLLAVVAGILPIIGTAIVFIPVIIFLIADGALTATLGVLIFGIISSNIDNILRPFILSKLTTRHSAVVLAGMVGGVFAFGPLGVIIGPLVLEYLIIVLEIYRGVGFLTNPDTN